MLRLFLQMDCFNFTIYLLIKVLHHMPAPWLLSCAHIMTMSSDLRLVSALTLRMYHPWLCPYLLI